MRLRRRTAVLVAGAAAVAVGATVAIAGSFGSGDLTGVANANPKATGFNEPNILSPQLQEVVWAQGSMPLDGATSAFPTYGYNGNGPQIPAFVSGATASNVEATKTEPDKNTYVVFGKGAAGPASGYDYGTHFVFQGHENGAPMPFSAPYVPAGTTVKGSSITRINLDGDGAHRVTLFATQTETGAPLAQIDGSNWDPFAQKLLFTTETAFADPPSTTPATPAPPGPSIYQSTADYPPRVTDISNVVGRAGFEGVQEDSKGNLYLVEDVGGANGTGANAEDEAAEQLRLPVEPADPSNLAAGGQLQVLQVTVNGSPLKFTPPAGSPPSAAQIAAAADTDISGANSAGYVSLHQAGSWFATKWIDIGTPTTASTPLPGADDNALAKAAGAHARSSGPRTSLPARLEVHGVLLRRDGRHRQPDVRRRRARAQSNLPACTTPNVTGGFTTIFKLVQSPKSDSGTISVLLQRRPGPCGLRQRRRSSRRTHRLRRGRRRHAARPAERARLGVSLRRRPRTTRTARSPMRFIAEGRDAAATIDSGLSGSTGFQNDGDNEITGLYVSDGDTGTGGLLGTKSRSSSRERRVARLLDAAARRQRHVRADPSAPRRPVEWGRRRGRRASSDREPSEYGAGPPGGDPRRAVRFISAALGFVDAQPVLGAGGSRARPDAARGRLRPPGRGGSRSRHRPAQCHERRGERPLEAGLAAARANVVFTGSVTAPATLTVATTSARPTGNRDGPRRVRDDIRG